MAGSRGRKRRKVEPRTRAQKIFLRYGWIAALAALAAGLGVLVLTYAFASIPLPQDIDPATSAQVYDVDGRLIGTYSDEVTRFLIDTGELLDVKPFIGQAVVAAEDRSFYKHNGVSVRGMLRAAWANITGGGVQQGGSTITQQYIKNAVLEDPSRTITRKIKEAVLAIKLERRFDKRQILGFYLNTIYLGRGAYGIEAAARTYFDKPARELTLHQAAYLAAIIPAPEAYQPDTNAGKAKRRRDAVLDQMVRAGYVSEAQAAQAQSKPIGLAKGTQQADREKRQRAAYFMEWLRRNFLEPEFGERLYTRGLKIYTTLDLDMQSAAEGAVAAVLPNKEDPQAAVVTMTSKGEVRALVGGRDFDNTRKARGFNYATTFPGRQAGSAFKPFTLLTAIEEGISPRSRFSGSSPKVIPDEECYTDGQPWEVDNYGGSSFGTIDLVAATTNSVNTVFAQLAAETGPEKVAETVEAFGFNPKDGGDEVEANCSLALGTMDVTPLEMARAYAGFAGRGDLPHVVPVRYVTTSEGDCLVRWLGRKDCEVEHNVRPERDVVAENSVDVMNQALETVVTSGTATAANIGRPVAGKTGTTQRNQNAWFAGHTPQMATAVWIGYPLDGGPDGKLGRDCGKKADTDEAVAEAQRRCGADDFIPEMRFCSDTELCRPVVGNRGFPIEVTGGSFPAEIWGTYMEEALSGLEVEDFPEPEDLPDEVINAPAPAPVPSASEDEEDEPGPEPTIEPSPQPTGEPSPAPQPSTFPTPPQPSPTGGGARQGEGDP
jgi:penicillin-binding protein 1A